jgi:two-component system sensor histidine kinase KdpD
MLAVSLISCSLTTGMKTQAALAKERGRRAELLYEVNQKLLIAHDVGEIARLTAEYLDRHINRPSAFYAKDIYDNSAFAMIHSTGTEREAARFSSEPQLAYIAKIYKDPSKYMGFIFSNPPISYIPILAKNSVLGLVGVIGLEDPPDPNILSFMQLLIGQVALAMELQYSVDQWESVRIDAEKEKNRGMLLRAISHDLRTPLTVLVNAGSMIEERAGKLDVSTICQYASDIKNNADWLIRMVENLLAVTRISGGAMKVNKTMEIAEEVMAQAVSNVRKWFPESVIHVKAAGEPLLVPMDATLISQVLNNLLENAVKYSPPGSPVYLTLYRNDGYAQFEVSDHGKGIPEQVLDHLFETFIPNQEQIVSSAGGVGIGLSICKTIVDAHGGRIVGQNKPGGGAVFHVMLPLNKG